MPPRKKTQAASASETASTTTRRSTRKKDASDEVVEQLPEEVAPKMRGAKKASTTTASTRKRGRGKVVEPEPEPEKEPEQEPDQEPEPEQEQEPESIEIDNAPVPVKAPKTRKTRQKKAQVEDDNVQAASEPEPSTENPPKEQQPPETKTRGRSRRQKKSEAVDDPVIEPSEPIVELAAKDDAKIIVEEEAILEKPEPRGRGRRAKKAPVSDTQLPETSIEAISAHEVPVAAETATEKAETQVEDGLEAEQAPKRRGRVGRRKKEEVTEEVPPVIEEAVEQQPTEAVEAELPVVDQPTSQMTEKAAKSKPKPKPKQTRGRKKETKEEDTTQLDAQLPETLEAQPKDEAEQEQIGEQKTSAEEVAVPPTKSTGRSKNKRRGVVPTEEAEAAMTLEPANNASTMEVSDETKEEPEVDEPVKPKAGRSRRQTTTSRRPGRRKEEAVENNIVEATVETTEDNTPVAVEQTIEGDENEPLEAVEASQIEETKQSPKTRRSRRTVADQEGNEDNKSSEGVPIDTEETSHKAEEGASSSGKSSRARRGRPARKAAQIVDIAPTEPLSQIESPKSQAAQLLEGSAAVLSTENVMVEQEAESVQLVAETEPIGADNVASNVIEDESAESEVLQQKNKRGRKRSAVKKSAPPAKRSTRRAKNVDTEFDGAKEGSDTMEAAKIPSLIESSEEIQAESPVVENEQKEGMEVKKGEDSAESALKEQIALEPITEDSLTTTAATEDAMVIEDLKPIKDTPQKSSRKKRPSSVLKTKPEEDEDSTPRKRTKTEDTKSAVKESVSNEVDLDLQEASSVTGTVEKRVFEPEMRRISSRKSLTHKTPTKPRETKSCPQTAPRRLVYSTKELTNKAATSTTPEKVSGDQEEIVEDEQVVAANTSDECATPEDAQKPFTSLETKADSVTRFPLEQDPLNLQSPLANSGLATAAKQTPSRRKAPASRKSFPYVTPKKNSPGHAGVPRSAPRASTIPTLTKAEERSLTPESHRDNETPPSLEAAGVPAEGNIGDADRESTEDDIVENVSTSSIADEEVIDPEFHCAADRTLPFAQEHDSNDSTDDQTGYDASTVVQEIVSSNESPNSTFPCQASPVQCSTPTPRKSLLSSVESPVDTTTATTTTTITSITATPIPTAKPCELGDTDNTLASEQLGQIDEVKSNEEGDSPSSKEDECVSEKNSPCLTQQVTPQNAKSLSRPFGGGPLATSTPLVNALKQHPSINNRLIEGDDISDSMIEGVWEGDTSMATVDYGDSTIIDEDVEGDDNEDMLEKWNTGKKFEFPKRHESSRPCASPKVAEDSATLKSSPPSTTQQQELNPDLELSLFGPGPPEINENGIEDSEISELHEWEVGQVDDEMESNESISSTPHKKSTRDLSKGSQTPQPKPRRDSRKSRPSLPARLSGYHQKLLRSNAKPQGSPLKQCQTITENGGSSPLQAASVMLTNPGSRLGAESPTPSIKRTPNKTPMKRLWQETGDESIISELNDAEVDWLNKGIELGTPLTTGTPQSMGSPRKLGTPSKTSHTPKAIRTPGALGTPRRRRTPSALGTPQRLATPRSRTTPAGTPKVSLGPDSSTPLLKVTQEDAVTSTQSGTPKPTDSPHVLATPTRHSNLQKPSVAGATTENDTPMAGAGKLLKRRHEEIEGADTLMSSPGISSLFRTPQKARVNDTEDSRAERVSSPMLQANMSPEQQHIKSLNSEEDLQSDSSDQEDFSILSATGPLRTVMSQLQPEIPPVNQKSPRKTNFHTNLPAVRHSINTLQVPPTATGLDTDVIDKKGARRNTLSGEIKSGNTIHPDPERARLSYLGSPPVVTEQDVLVEQDVITAEEAENERQEELQANNQHIEKESDNDKCTIEETVSETTSTEIQGTVSEQADVLPDGPKTADDPAQDDFLDEFVARYAAKKAAKAEEQTSASDSDSSLQDTSAPEQLSPAIPAIGTASTRVFASIKRSPSQKMKKANIADIESPIRRSPRSSSATDPKAQSPVPDNSKAGQTPKLKPRSHKVSSLPVLSSKGRQSKSKTSKSQPSALSAPPPRLDLLALASAGSSEIPSLSQLAPRELAKITAKNTTVNALWENVTFEREVVQRDIPRPPSPNGKRQTIQANDMRRKRKAVEEETGIILGPGDELDFVPQIVTPSRKRVKWNGPLELGREEELPRTSPKLIEEIPRKSVLKQHRIGTEPEPEKAQPLSKVKVVRYLYLGEKDEYS